MGAGKIQVYTLGHTGVILDQSPLEPSVPDEALVRSQNMTHDPKEQHGGALRKRPGLARFNKNFVLSGPVLGGMPMAVPQNGGAPSVPADITTATGDSTGGGDSSGAPGGTTSPGGGGDPVYPSVGAGIFNNGTPVFGGGRIIVIGRDGNDRVPSSGRGAGWYLTSVGVANSATELTTPGPPGTANAIPETLAFKGFFGQPSYFDQVGKKLYYQQATAQSGSTQIATPLYMTDGNVNQLIATLPVGPDAAFVNFPTLTGGKRQAVMQMIKAANGVIWLVVKEKSGGEAGGTNNNVGNLYKYDPSTGALTLALANSGDLGFVPTWVTEFRGNIWFGGLTFTTATVDEDQAAGLFVLSPPDASKTVLTDRSIASPAIAVSGFAFPTVAPPDDPSFDALGNQCLFIGTGISTAGTVTDGVVYVRTRDPILATGTKTLQVSLTATGGSSAAIPAFVSFAEFKGKLYASYYGPNGSKVYQLTPDYTQTTSTDGRDPLTDYVDGKWNGAGTWTSVVGMGSNNMGLFVDGETLYAIGENTGAGTARAFSTTDGVTWVDGSANVPAGANASNGIMVFGAFDQ